MVYLHIHHTNEGNAVTATKLMLRNKAELLKLTNMDNTVHAYQSSSYAQILPKLSAALVAVNGGTFQVTKVTKGEYTKLQCPVETFTGLVNSAGFVLNE